MMSLGPGGTSWESDFYPASGTNRLRSAALRNAWREPPRRNPIYPSNSLVSEGVVIVVNVVAHGNTRGFLETGQSVGRCVFSPVINVDDLILCLCNRHDGSSGGAAGRRVPVVCSSQ